MAIVETPCIVARACTFCNVVSKVDKSGLSPSLPGYRYTVLMKSPRRELLGLSEGWLVYRFSLGAELFLMRIVQTLCSSERLQRCNSRLNWVGRESNSHYHRQFARTRRVTEKELLSVVENNRCTGRLSTELRLSARTALVLGTLVYQFQRRLMTKNQFGPTVK